MAAKLLQIASFSATRLSCRLFSSSQIVHAKVAVVLSGCGVYDGSEIHEACACLVQLSRNNIDTAVFAPNIDQLHVIDHVLGEPAKGEKRNVLAESARIARGHIQPLDELKVRVFDAVIFPGGFGAAKNLSSFATDGVKMTVNQDVERVLKNFHTAKKPIALCCIAPVLAAKVIPGCEVTIGSDAATADVIRQLGATHVNKTVAEVHVDAKNKIVTTPAFMCEAGLHEIFDGIGLMIRTLLKMLPK